MVRYQQVVVNRRKVIDMKKWLLAFMLSLCLLGCVEGISTDPNTGEQTEYHYVDPNVADSIEGTAEGVVGGMAALLPLLPWLAPFVTAGGGILATFKKMKPKLTAAEKEKSDFARGGAVLAAVLQEVKVKQPDMWDKIGPVIHNHLKYSKDIDAAIKEFRRLAPSDNNASI